MSWREWLQWLLHHPTPPPSPSPTPSGDLLGLHNAERNRRGAPPLTADARLTQAAQAHARQMAAAGRLSHDGWQQHLQASGYPARRAGENVAAGTNLTEAGAWSLWANDPPHLANAVDPGFHDVGFGSAVGRDGMTYYAAIFGAT